MITILFAISVLVYVILSWMIVYHLQTYTIDKRLAHRAIVVFGVVTVSLIVVQSIFFLQIESVARNATKNTRTDVFSTF